MEKLLKQIENLKASEISEVIEQRIKEFEQNGKEKEDRIFSELCFCLLTANFSAEKCIKIQDNVGRNHGFELLPKEKLAEELKKHQHRFPNTRAGYIAEARSCKSDLIKIMKKNGKEMREWLVENVKGLGMKESSHFLRNIGYKDVAIIDFHILDLLSDNNVIDFDRHKQILKKQTYIEIEKILEEVANKTNLDLARLDLYLWYLETGKVLK